MKKLFVTASLVISVGVVSLIALSLQPAGGKAGEVTTGRSLFDYSAATGNIEPVSDGIPVSARLLEHGEWVFRGLCIGCHGVEGDGNGAVWTLGEQYARDHQLPRKPRGFHRSGLQTQINT